MAHRLDAPFGSPADRCLQHESRRKADMQLIFDVWREVCRHLEIHESVERLLPRLAESLPLDAVVIRRIDRPRSCLETVASGLARANTRVPAAKTALREAELATLLKWCKRGDVAQRIKSSATTGARKAAPPR